MEGLDSKPNEIHRSIRPCIMVEYNQTCGDEKRPKQDLGIYHKSKAI